MVAALGPRHTREGTQVLGRFHARTGGLEQRPQALAQQARRWGNTVQLEIPVVAFRAAPLGGICKLRVGQGHIARFVAMGALGHGSERRGNPPTPDVEQEQACRPRLRPTHQGELPTPSPQRNLVRGGALSGLEIDRRQWRYGRRLRLRRRFQHRELNARRRWVGLAGVDRRQARHGFGRSPGLRRGHSLR